MREIEASYDRPALLSYLENQFKIDWGGVHGINHWLRVQQYGIRVGIMRKADLLVVELFALLHDSCRVSEHHDPSHGERAAEFAHGLNGTFFSLSSHQLDLLCVAIHFHSDGYTHSDSTIQSCWDGDRLDLGRVGIRPHRNFLSPEAADLYELSIA